MGNRLSTVLVAAAVAALGYKGIAQPQSEIKLAYIDQNAILAQAPGAAEAQATFEREMARWRSELEALQDSLQQLVTAYEQQQIMLSPQKRQERQQELQRKSLEVDQRRIDLQQVAQRRQLELLQPITDEISQVLASVRDEYDYTMIFERNALMQADTTLDITAMVIERLKAAQTGEGNAN